MSRPVDREALRRKTLERADREANGRGKLTNEALRARTLREEAKRSGDVARPVEEVPPLLRKLLGDRGER